MNGQDIPTDPSEFRFRTAHTGRFSFLVFGDSGADTVEQHTLVSRMAAERGVGMIVHTGDLVYPEGSFAQYDLSFFGPNSRMRQLPVFPTPGNHDYRADGGAAYRAGLVPPASDVPAQDVGRYFSFDWGDAHFVSVDSNQLPGEGADRMLDWFQRDLGKTRKYWKIVYFHHAPYPTGHHRNDPVCALARQRIIPIVERYGVQLVLAGHEHAYERTLPLRSGAAVSSGPSTVYIISGGGGANLQHVGSEPWMAVGLQKHHYLRVDVDGGRLTVRAIGLDGEELDRVALSPEPVLMSNGITSAADGSSRLAPGALASVFGWNFAPQDASKRDCPLPAELSGVTVAVDEAPAPLLYVSPGQINFQVPYQTGGSVALRVTTPNGSISTNFAVAETAPAILALMAENEPVSMDHPVKAGERISVYATGLGAVSGPVAAGQPAPAPALTPMARVLVSIGDRLIRPLSVGLVPGTAGVYQVDAVVPDWFSSRSYPVRIRAGGVISRSAGCAVTRNPLRLRSRSPRKFRRLVTPVG
jgi:uncharacterized protein (TIGR03437 family)